MTKRKEAARWVGQVWTLHVESLDPDGAGVAEHQGRRVAVMGAHPGDVVEARVTWASATSPWARAQLLRRLELSAAREPASCPHAPDCPGCIWAGMPQPLQLEAKRQRLVSALVEAGHAVHVGPVQPAPQLWGWRIRAKYVVDHRANGSAGLGAYAPGSHDVVSTVSCGAVHPLVNQAARALEVLLQETAPSALKHVLVRTNGRQTLGLLVVSHAGDAAVRALASRWRASCGHLSGVLEHVNAGSSNALLDGGSGAVLLDGQATVAQDLSGITVDAGPLAFQQLHPGAAQGLMAHVERVVADLLAQREGGLVVDAYCGLGAFAWGLRGHAARVLGLEENGEAVAAAHRAAANAGLGHVTFEQGDAAARLSAWSGPAPDVVVVDPPRRGLAGAMVDTLARRRPRALVYVACEPKALARDARALVSAGFELGEVSGWDLFPHTAEVEAVAVFRLVGGD